MVSSQEIAYFIISGMIFTFIMCFGIVKLVKKNHRIKELSEELIKETEDRKELEKLEIAISTQEKERVEIARQLHDDVGALLSMAHMNLVNFEDNAEQGIVDNQAVSLGKEYVSESIQILRSITKGMTPQYLIKFGLERALENMSKHKSRNLVSSFIFSSEIPERVQLSDLISIHNYYIVGELITNLIKHSYPTEIRMKLVVDSKLLKIKIQHNGIALTQKDFDRLLIESDSTGLENIRYRLNILKADLLFKRFKSFGIIELITKINQNEHHNE